MQACGLATLELAWILSYYANTLTYSKTVITQNHTLLCGHTYVAFCIPFLFSHGLKSLLYFLLCLLLWPYQSISQPGIFRGKALSELTAGRLWFNSDRSTAFKAISSLFVSLIFQPISTSSCCLISLIVPSFSSFLFTSLLPSLIFLLFLLAFSTVSFAYLWPLSDLFTDFLYASLFLPSCLQTIFIF